MELLNLLVRIGVKDEASDAVNDVSGNIISKLASAAKTAAKALAGMWAVKKVVDFGKAAFDAYSSFEQLQGGVAKLYGNAGMSIEEYAESVGKSAEQVTNDYKRNAEAQKMVMENAQQAWKTAGMDANAYMQTATSFSASLINSLGGDTKEAARLTDEAMVAMSDNVNTFGSDMASVQNAFQGFAKGNFVMLDNLKLGYGGTKTEMERLISDASKMTQEQEALNMKVDAGSTSFDNIVRAIQVVQKHQGIYGTTAKEAMSTIEGSMNATKAAWQNLVTEFGKPDADIGARVSDLVDGIFGIVDEKTGQREGGLFKNVTTEVGAIATNMVNAVGQGVQAGFDWLMQNGPTLVDNALGSIQQAMQGAIDGLSGILAGNNPFESLFNDASGIVEKVSGFVSGIGATIQERWPEIVATAGTLWDQFANVVTTYGPTILSNIGSVLGNIGNTILEHWPEIQGAAAEAWLSLVEWVTSNGPALVSKAAEIIGNVVETAKNWLVANGPAIFEAASAAFGNVVNAIVEHGPQILSNIGETIGLAIGYVADAAPRLLSAAAEFMGGLITGTSEQGQVLHQWFADFFPDGLLSGLGDFATFLLDAGKSLIDGLLSGIGKAAPNVETAIRSAFDSVIGFFSGIADFIANPVGSIQDFMATLSGSSEGTAGSVESSMQSVIGSTEEAVGEIEAYNATEFANKEATATVTGNAQDGTAKDDVKDTNSTMKAMASKSVKAGVTGNAQDGKAETAVRNTNTAVQNLSGKTISVSANGNVVSGAAKSQIDGTKAAIDRLRDKNVTVTTNYRNTTSGPTKAEQARGGLRLHARGDIMVANRYTDGVPLDIVGEAGPEAIVPLTSHYGHEFARIMGQEAGKYIGGGGGVNIYLTYNAGEDATALVNDIASELRTLGLVS